MSEAIDVITEETEVSTTELACVLGITGRRIRQMAEDGQLQKVSKGRFLLADSVQRYVKFLSDGPMDEEDKKLEKTRRVAETTMKASKATIAKLEAEELKGTMHRAEDVAALTEDLVYTIRGALNALPGRLAVDVAAVSTPAEASEVIRKEVSKVMRELAGSGMTMVVVTHEMGFAREVGNRVLFMDEGIIMEENAPAELFGNPQSERLKTFLSKVL